MAAPVALGERDLYLIAVGAELAKHPVHGLGLVNRLCADLQNRFTVPARIEATTGTPRHDAKRDRNRARQRVEAEA